MSRAMLALCVCCLVLAPLAAADWPHWMGPARDGTSPEKGLLTAWPKDGPRVLWKVAGGDGYSSIAVSGGKAFTLVQRGGKELLICLDVNDKGKQLWQVELAGAYKNQYGNGPRSTPASDGQFVYATSVSGPVVCVDIAKGSVVWKKDLLKEFKAENLQWGLSASPVIDGDLVYVIPGAQGAGVAALNKKDGSLKWRVGDDGAAYASPAIATVGGKKQVIFFNAYGLVAVDPAAGKELWRMEWKTEYDCNICTPLVIGENLFVSSGENVGCAMLKLKADGKPDVIWESKGPRSVMKNYWANAVYQDGYLYGVSGEFSGVIHLNCVDAKDGSVKWSQMRFGKAAITLADGHLWMTTKTGDLVLARATPTGYEEKARLKEFLGENRTVPTISGGKLFLRDLKDIWCLDVSGK